MTTWGSVVILLVAGLFAPCASATLQQRDTIAIDGKVEEMRVYPLQPWLAGHPDALPDSGIFSTDRMRGYVAHWMLVHGILELARVDESLPGPGIEGPVVALDFDTAGRIRPLTVADVASERIPIPVERDVLPILFPGRARVVADWYSGTLVIPQGAMLDRAGFADSTLYARYLLVIVEKGRELKRLRLDSMAYDAYRQARFRRFQQTPAYDAAMRELLERGWTPDDALANVYGDQLEQYISLEPTPDE